MAIRWYFRKSFKKGIHPCQLVLTTLCRQGLDFIDVTQCLTSVLANLCQCECFGCLSDRRFHLTEVCRFEYFYIPLNSSSSQQLSMPHRVQRGVGM